MCTISGTEELPHGCISMKDGCVNCQQKIKLKFWDVGHIQQKVSNMFIIVRWPFIHNALKWKISDSSPETTWVCNTKLTEQLLLPTTHFLVTFLRASPLLLCLVISAQLTVPLLKWCRGLQIYFFGFLLLFCEAPMHIKMLIKFICLFSCWSVFVSLFHRPHLKNLRK